MHAFLMPRVACRHSFFTPACSSQRKRAAFGEQCTAGAHSPHASELFRCPSLPSSPLPPSPLQRAPPGLLQRGKGESVDATFHMSCAVVCFRVFKRQGHSSCSCMI